MLIHAWVAYAERPFQTSLMLELMFGAINFAVMISMYYTISRAAFSNSFLILGVAAVCAIALGAGLNEDITYLSMSAGWAAVLGTSVLCGVLTNKNVQLPKVLGISAVVLMALASVQLFPMWAKLISSSTMIIEEMTADIGETFVALGYAQETVSNMVYRIKLFYSIFLRVLPSFTLLAVVFQFAIGFWLFVLWLKKNRPAKSSFPNFLDWKMPFALIPLVVVGVIMRLAGGETIKLIADNLIVVLAIIYSIVGMAFLEYFMKKFRFSIFSRIIVYFLILFTHVAGLAFLALVGFADSFFDWRRKYPLP